MGQFREKGRDEDSVEEEFEEPSGRNWQFANCPKNRHDISKHFYITMTKHGLILEETATDEFQ